MAHTKEKIATSQDEPDHFTKISFYINLSISIYFLFWNLMTFLTLNNDMLIEKYKHLTVSEMIEKRGRHLGFTWQEFQTSLNQYCVISFILFIPIALGLFLLWKKRTAFYPLILISTLLQLLLMIILLGPTYFWNDNTFTDKILWLVLITNSTLYRGLLKKEGQSGKISFFD